MRGHGPLVLAVLLAACGGSPASAPDPDSTDLLRIENAWTRPSPPATSDAAIYLRLINDSDQDDFVLGASSPRCVLTHLHVTTTEEGLTGMDPVGPDGFTVPAHGELDLAPLGIHVMCMELTAPLTQGEDFDLRVYLERFGWVDTRVSVQTQPPA